MHTHTDTNMLKRNHVTTAAGWCDFHKALFSWRPAFSVRSVFRLSCDNQGTSIGFRRDEVKKKTRPLSMESVEPRCHPGCTASFASSCAFPFDLPAGPSRLQGELRGLPQSCSDGRDMYITATCAYVCINMIYDMIWYDLIPYNIVSYDIIWYNMT